MNATDRTDSNIDWPEGYERTDPEDDRRPFEVWLYSGIRERMGDEPVETDDATGRGAAQILEGAIREAVEDAFENPPPEQATLVQADGGPTFTTGFDLSIGSLFD